MAEVEEFVLAEMRVSYPGPCCRMAARWIERRIGFPPLVMFGRDFQTDADVAAWLAERGGFAIAVSSVMRACGIPRTRNPEPGDVGIALDFTGRPVMAIRGQSLWFSRENTGALIGVPVARFRRAWAL